MGQWTGLLILAAILGITLLLMRMMWRQMRKVNAHTAEVRRTAMAAEIKAREPRYDEWDAERGQYVPASARVNDELIRQGAKASQSDFILPP
jgi:glycine/D-amino acid oxidase-like deaminating enzyme